MGDLALSLVIALINNAAAISAVVRQAHAEGRELNAADWAAIDAADDTAAARQAISLARARAEGR
jgi:hypothetical protein